ncbi:MAG TPA: helix-hairpin-helix domain-containing protein [Candidatus Woesebacteria bacterium]|nr:helix-hairpin-helix domain-containing protein [Candidatus Woesebacteria bacterium]
MYTFIQTITHPVEIILIIASIIITFVTFVIFSRENTSPSVPITVEAETDTTEDSQTITIDLSGSVKKPNVYTISENTTLHEVIKQAGGLSEEADNEYVSRFINLARTLSDKEKVYIPSKKDIEEGYTNESNILSEQTQYDNQQNSNTISVNSATEQELDTLPGIGPATAQKIINNRPYESLEELISKKAVNSTAFEKIKDLISL